MQNRTIMKTSFHDFKEGKTNINANKTTNKILSETRKVYRHVHSEVLR